MPESGNSPARAALADAVEALGEGFALFDGDGRLVICNERFRSANPTMAPLLVPGVTWDLLLREARTRGVLDAAAEQRLRWMESRLEPGTPETAEIVGASDTVTALTLAATRQGGFVLTARDVTARRRLEAAEREQDLILREVLEACPANVVMSRVGDGQVIYRSPAAVELLGPRRNSHEYFSSSEERGDFITALLPNGRVDDMPVTCLHADGEPFPAAISARLIDYRGEDVVVSTITDLTREIGMQAELDRQRETIFQNEKMSALGELLAGVAHELNNPLSVVVGHALMLREDTADPEVLRRIDKIGEAAERCARIIRSFLAMARQEPATLAAVDLDAAIETAIDALRNGPGGLRARLDTELAGDLPPVLADADQIAQVVVNLVVNADQAIAGAGTGGLIRVSSRRAADMVEFRVEDDGPGVLRELQGRIFEPFFTTKPMGDGTGLGLALAHRVVTSHKGAIAVEQRQGGGSVFVVQLPATAPALPEAPEAPAVATASRPARVLIVEDEAEVAELMREILVRQGFEVDHARSAEAALERLDAGYAIVLSDLAMPGLGGRGLYAAMLRDHPALARRTAFVTGDTMGPAARAFLAGAERPYLEKPIAPAELRELVAQLQSAQEVGA